MYVQTEMTLPSLVGCRARATTTIPIIMSNYSEPQSCTLSTIVSSRLLDPTCPSHVWMGFHIVEHHQRCSPPEARASSPSLSYPHSDTRPAIGQVPASGSTSRRRISGLNSRFDRMLWEASLTTRTFKSLPSRHKHTHSSSSGDLGTCFMVVTDEVQSSKTPPRIDAGLSPFPNKGDQFCPSEPLPNWLDNTLATLPPSHPVRRLILPLDRPIGRDLIDHDPYISDEDAVFAFQALPCDSLLGHPGSDGHSGARVAVTVSKPFILNSGSRKGTPDSDRGPFEATHNGSVECRENSLTVLRSVPFSTPGPGCTTSRASAARSPWRGNPILSRITVDGSQKAMDVPPPFSTPGPFASRPVSGHGFGNYPVAPHIPPEEVYPTIQKSSAVPILSSHTSKSDRIDIPLYPVQDGSRQFSALPNLFPGFTSNNLATEPTFPGNRGVVTPSPGPPMGLARRSGMNGNIASDDISMVVSDDLLGQKTLFGAFSLPEFPISPSPEAESLHCLRGHMVPDTFPRTPMTPPQSILPGFLSTNFDWVSPDAQSPGSSESIGWLDIADADTYTPTALISEPVRETSGTFAPTPGILFSPLLDADSTANTSVRGIGDVSWHKKSVRDIF
ncbi:hypothetical protein EDB86DRAFT_347432 [Lactarius hatsudake]|nr:hypothetical protein EDB86DRAFT_347432 [Lactarius hatsudake]